MCDHDARHDLPFVDVGANAGIRATNVSASATWSARCSARTQNTNRSVRARKRAGRRIMKPWLTGDNGAGSSRTATALTETQVAEQLGLSLPTLPACHLA